MNLHKVSMIDHAKALELFDGDVMKRIDCKNEFGGVFLTEMFVFPYD